MKKALIIVDVQPTFAKARTGCSRWQCRRGTYRGLRECASRRVRIHRNHAGLAYRARLTLVGATRLCGYVARARQGRTPGAELHPAIAALHVEHHFKKGQYSPSYSGFEGYEDNTDSIPSREQVASDMATGRTLAVALESAGIECVDVVGLADRTVSRKPRWTPVSLDLKCMSSKT